MRGGRHPIIPYLGTTNAIFNQPPPPPQYYSSLHRTHTAGVQRKPTTSLSNTPSGKLTKKGTHLLEFILDSSHCCSTPKNTQLPFSACVGSWDRVWIVGSLYHTSTFGRVNKLDDTSYHACTITNTKLPSQNNNRDRLDNSSKEIHPGNVCFPLLNIVSLLSFTLLIGVAFELQIRRSGKI